MDTNHFTELREKMVQLQILSRGISDENGQITEEKDLSVIFVPLLEK